MANCPCEAESATCVDSTAPVTRSLDGGGCVHLGLATSDTDSVALTVNGSGELEAEVQVSANAGQALQALPSGLFVAESSQLSAENFLCDTSSCDCGDIDPDPTSLPLACNGLEARACPDGPGTLGLWAPPETKALVYSAQDNGTNKFDFVNGTYPGGYIPAGAGVNSGDFTLEGYTYRQVPVNNSGGSPTANVKYEIANPWCVPGLLDVYVGGIGGKFRFEDPLDTWVIDVFHRIYLEASGGGTNIWISGVARCDAALSVQAGANAGDLSYTVPSLRSNPVIVDAGDYKRIRTESIIFIRQNGTSGVVLSSLTGLRLEHRASATLTAFHDVTSSAMTNSNL